MAHAFLSKRVVTQQGTRPGALLVEDETIRAICRPSEIPADAIVHDCGNEALLPGLVDTHVHINQPGRTEWEGFRTATQAAAAGGYTTLVDMPLNCLPETTTVAALEEKRSSTQETALLTGPPGVERSRTTNSTSFRSRAPACSASNASSSTPGATASP